MGEGEHQTVKMREVSTRHIHTRPSTVVADLVQMTLRPIVLKLRLMMVRPSALIQQVSRIVVIVAAKTHYLPCWIGSSTLPARHSEWMCLRLALHVCRVSAE